MMTTHGFKRKKGRYSHVRRIIIRNGHIDGGLPSKRVGRGKPGYTARTAQCRGGILTHLHGSKIGSIVAILDGSVDVRGHIPSPAFDVGEV